MIKINDIVKLAINYELQGRVYTANIALIDM